MDQTRLGNPIAQVHRLPVHRGLFGWIGKHHMVDNLRHPAELTFVE